MKAKIPDGKSQAENRIKEIEELMKHPLSADDIFSFRCKQCGGCCKDRNDILLSPFDIPIIPNGLSNVFSIAIVTNVFILNK